MTTDLGSPAASLPAVDRFRRDRYLLRFAWAMQDHPGREYRRIKRELRAEITAAAADVGMVAALRDLGHPVALAEGYRATLDGPRPRYVTGAVAAGLTIGAIAYLVVAYSLGFLDALAATGGGSATLHPLGAETTFTGTDTEMSVGWTLTWQWLVLYLGSGTVAFVLGSRLWRAARRRG